MNYPCIKCTIDQYERDLKQSLLNMGFIEVDMITKVGGEEYHYLMTNWEDSFGQLGFGSGINLEDRYIMSEYDPKLFLSEVEKCINVSSPNLFLNVVEKSINTDLEYPYWFVSKHFEDITKKHARMLTDDLIGTNSIVFEVLNKNEDQSNLIRVSKDLKLNEISRFILKTDYDQGLSIGTPMMVSDSGEHFVLGYYSGDLKCYLSTEKTTPYSWKYIIPFDKFNPMNIEKSLTYSINNHELS